MKRLALMFALLILCVGGFSGCTLAGNARDYATMGLYAVEHKVLVFVKSPCSDALHPDKPYLVSGWVREKNLNRLTVICKPDCTDCRISVR